MSNCVCAHVSVWTEEDLYNLQAAMIATHCLNDVSLLQSRQGIQILILNHLFLGRIHTWRKSDKGARLVPSSP